VVVSSVTPRTDASCFVYQPGLSPSRFLMAAKSTRSSSLCGCEDGGVLLAFEPRCRSRVALRRRRGSCWWRRRRPLEDAVGEVPVLRERLALVGKHGGPALPMAAAAWSWVEKMLHDAQRTSAPRAFRVSIRTAVWMVMCSEPEMRAPRSGCSSRTPRGSP